MLRGLTITLTIGAALSLGACANNENLLGGVSSQPTAALPAKSAVKPECVVLAARIDGLRNEGVVERVEAAASGKTATVSVKRASLGQIAELEKVNDQFRTQCSALPRTAMAAPAKPPVPAKTATPAKKPAVDAAKATAAAAKTAADAAQPKQP